MKRLLALGSALSAVLLTASSAHAFSGEDPVFGDPWHHESLTENAAKSAGWSAEAADALGWHADYIDSYLYNPLWWARGGFDRYKVSHATKGELEKLHFDDLFSTPQVNLMWRRVASGTFAGLMWARENNDIHAAQNIVGVSLHAMQDFYSHSNWVDKPERRTRTFFEYARAARLGEAIYTGAYEHDHAHGAKSHGKWTPSNAVWGQPGVKQIMEVACEPISPFSNTDSCAAYKVVKAGTGTKPVVTIVELPPSIMTYAPAGIALDNTWVADMAVKERGLTGISGAQAFQTAHDLAGKQSLQWLQTLDTAMQRAQASGFWSRVKNTPASESQRTQAFEKYNKFPFTFLSAGDYPPNANARLNAEEWFLRVRLKTAQGMATGTDSDIKLRAGGKDFVLDYLPGENPVFAYNDFESGDDDIYVVGPFASLPSEIQLVNDAAGAEELLTSLGRDFRVSLENSWKDMGDFFVGIVGGHADRVAINKQLWTPEMLASVPSTSQAFTVDLNGGKEGHYTLSGTISKVGETEDHTNFKIQLDKLQCIKESTWDRGSNSDEPFVLVALNMLPGQQQTWLSPVYGDVDSGESRDANYGFIPVSLPKGSGMLNLAVSLMESDDETHANRQELMVKFAGLLEEGTRPINRSFTDALATNLGAGWKIGSVEVVAWSRNGTIRQGRVLSQEVNRWLKPRQRTAFALDSNGARLWGGVTTDDLLPELAPDSPPPSPTEPPTSPAPPTSPNFDLTTWVDEWDTTYGRVKLVLENGVIKGRLMVRDEFTGLEKEGDRLELCADGANEKLSGTSSYRDFTSQVTLQLSADGNSFSANSTSPNGLRDSWTGTRRRATAPPTQPTVPTNPPVPTPPTLPPTVPTIPTVPANPTLPTVPTPPPASGEAFKPLGEWAVKIETARIAREAWIEVVASYKNTTRQTRRLSAGSLNMVVTDMDGVGWRNVCNLYAVGGDPDLEPERISGDLIAEPGATVQTLALFPILPGATPLKSLTVFGASQNIKPQVFALSNLTLPEPQTPALPLQNAVNGNEAFQDLDGQIAVRFDGLRRGRNGSVQAILTVQNVSANKNAWRTHPGYGLDVSIVDNTGQSRADEGNLYRVGGDPMNLKLIRGDIYLVPDGAATVVYPVTLPPNAVSKQLVVKFGSKTLTFELPPLP